MSFQVRLGLIVSIRFIVICLIGLSTLGCNGTGDGLGTVSGIVTLDGQPLSQVMVTFSPNSGGRESYGVTNAAGQYRLRYTSQNLGAKTGLHQVRVSPVGVEPREPAAKENSTVPSRYYGNGFLTQEVSPGNNQIDLHLSTSVPSNSG